MYNNLKIKKLNYITEQLVLYVYKKIEYDEIKKQYAACKLKLSEISKKIESLNNIEYPSNITFNISGFELKSNRALQLQILKEQEQLINKELTTHLKQLYDLHNLYMQHLTNFRSYSLESNELIEYFDIYIQLNGLFEIIKYILNNSFNDLNKLYTYGIKLPSIQQYKGKITTIEMIIAQKNICESKISDYNDLKGKIKLIQDKINKFEIYRKESVKRLNKIQIPFIGKFMLTKEKQKIKDDINMLNHEINDLRVRNHLKRENLEELKKEKENECYKYIKICENIDELIDELGEKSLRELTQKLNINITSTDDNYFNEKEEMRLTLKNLFEEENKKISNEIENNKILSKSR